MGGVLLRPGEADREEEDGGVEGGGDDAEEDEEAVEEHFQLRIGIVTRVVLGGAFLHDSANGASASQAMRRGGGNRIVEGETKSRLPT